MAEEKKTPRSRKTTSRVGSGTKAPKKTEEKQDVFLTYGEMMKMSEQSYEQQLIVKEAEKSVLHEELIVEQIKKLQVDLELQKVKSGHLLQDLKAEQKKAQEYVKTLKDKYQIQADKFSYQPETGKLILEDLI